MRPLFMFLGVCFLAMPIDATAGLDQSIRTFLEALDAGATPVIAGRTLYNPRQVSKIYRDRNHQPIWFNGLTSKRIPDLLAAIRESADHGFIPANYHASILARSITDESRIDKTAVELLATDAFLEQARHRSIGVVSPVKLDPEWHLIPPEVDGVAQLNELLEGNMSVEQVLDNLWPKAPEYQLLLKQRAYILEFGEPEAVTVPRGPLLKPGQTSDRVVLLKQRLLGPGEYDNIYYETLKTAVIEFQRSAGLEADGIVGATTLEVMNADLFSWIDRIDANLERWRWLPQETPDTYIRVNLASFSLRIHESGQETLGMDVIVGKPYRRSPVFSELLRYMVVNPSWNVPNTIAVEDKLPLLKKDPQALKSQGYEVRVGGQKEFRDVDTVDWSKVNPNKFPYLLRQRPGDFNALGRIKFMLPNVHAIYLHDTPTRHLFAKQERVFSSGCIRLSEPIVLARWLLNNDGQADKAAGITKVIQLGETTTYHLKRPIPVYIVYFTAFSNNSGEVIFRRDIYQRDTALARALQESRQS